MNDLNNTHASVNSQPEIKSQESAERHPSVTTCQTKGPYLTSASGSAWSFLDRRASTALDNGEREPMYFVLGQWVLLRCQLPHTVHPRPAPNGPNPGIRRPASYSSRILHAHGSCMRCNGQVKHGLPARRNQKARMADVAMLGVADAGCWRPYSVTC